MGLNTEKMDIKEDNSNKVYLGGGAYAVYEDEQVWLCADHHNNKLVCLDLPHVLERLNEFVKEQQEMRKNK